MGRRDKGTGRVFYRKDRKKWIAQAPKLNGGYKYFSHEFKHVARAYLEEAQQNLKQGQMPTNDRLTLRAYIEDWLPKAQRRHDLETSSWKHYAQALHRHVLPTLGGEKLAALSVPQVRNLYDQLSAKLAPTTLHTVHAVLRTALKDAVLDELIIRNVTDYAKPKPLKRKKRPFYTPAQANHLLAFAEQCGDRWEVLYWLVLNTAMRESELLSLRWSDIDFTQRRLIVRKSKTEAGERSPGLISQVVKRLQDQKKRLIEERLQAGPRWKDQGPIEQGLVFPNSVGRQQSVSRFLYHDFYPLLERAGLPRIHFHDLRHTSISWLLSLGIPAVDVAAYVGHADATTTLRIYAHSFPGSQQALLEALERAMLGGSADAQAVK